jgi:hypothetical protein
MEEIPVRDTGKTNMKFLEKQKAICLELLLFFALNYFHSQTTFIIS